MTKNNTIITNLYIKDNPKLGQPKNKFLQLKWRRKPKNKFLQLKWQRISRRTSNTLQIDHLNIVNAVTFDAVLK